MKKKTVVNTLIVGSIFLIFYFFVGHDFVKFYFGGKTEILEAAEHINKLCNANGSCPTVLGGWQKAYSGNHLFKGNMLYFVDTGEGGKDKGRSRKLQEFRLVYRFFMPDNWFEARGGVGMKVTSGWMDR
ncbi:MAG: hypothetical protein AB1427_07965 [Thermodesulfobacteriota bacterium]